jgi:UDP-3-O-[3-hydroxymyristoyl] glucosamine N-acyltransferase
MANGQYKLVGFADDRWPELPDVWGIPILGKAADLPSLRSHADLVIIAVGNEAKRKALFECAERVGFGFASIVHPRAIVSSTATIGRAVAVMAGAIVGSEARLDDGAIVNAGAIVDHHCTVGNFAQLSVGACMGGGSVLDPSAWLQEGCALRPGERMKHQSCGVDSLSSGR